MNHRDAYREHVARPRSSLDGVLGRAATSEASIRAMAARAWREHRIIVFTPADLERMPDFGRLMIEAEARRLYGEKRGR